MKITDFTPKKLPAISCVYKLHFDDGSFYIGKAKNFRSRLSDHISCITRQVEYGVYLNLTSRVLVSADIMYRNDCLNTIGRRESLEIKKEKNNPKLLNLIRDNAYSMEKQTGPTMVSIYRDRLKKREQDRSFVR